MTPSEKQTKMAKMEEVLHIFHKTDCEPEEGWRGPRRLSVLCLPVESEAESSEPCFPR